MTTNKKIAAAISGVIQYLKEEREENICIASSIGTAGEAFNAWRLYGRQSQMQMRSMMQMKAFHRQTVR